MWFKKAAGLFEVLNAGVVCEELAHVIVAFKEAPRHYLKYRQNRSLIKILNERPGLLRDGQIVAPGEDVGNLVLLLREAVEPEVLAQAHLGHELPVLRKVVVKVPSLQVLGRPF